MIPVTITRNETGDHGTFGRLIMPGFSCFTAELPWRDNQQRISCIPAGEYGAVLRFSQRFQKTLYWIKDVPGRSFVLIHAGNFAGDKAKGFKSNVEGCILQGNKLGTIGGQRAVLASGKTIYNFMKATNGQDLKLTISGAC